MSRFLLAVAISAVLNTSVGAQDAVRRPDSQPVTLEDLKKNPDDLVALRTYLNVIVLRFAVGMNTKPAAIHPAVLLEASNDMDAVVKNVKPQTAAGKSIVSNMSRQSATLRNQAKALQSPFANLAKQLADIERNVIADGDSKGTVGKIDAIKDKIQKATTTEIGKEHREVLDYLANYAMEVQRPLVAAHKLTEMIGKPAAPLNVEAWVNGAPLMDSDLAGKIVLLDFWAVYCGPCIASFPQLRKWHEKYADKGLVIIGVTGFYNFQWDDQTGTAVKSESKVSKADERAMLAKFAKSYDLMHRIAITSDDTLFDYYGGFSIPHVVVIDREGKIRLMKVGSDEKSDREIGELLEKLVGS